MGKYRRYGRRRRASRRRLKKTLPALGVALSFLYIFVAAYGSITIEGDFLGISVSGAKVINATLFKVTYIGSSENKSFTIWLRIGDRNIEFSVPGGEYGRVVKLRVSRLVDVVDGVVQPKIIIPDARINMTYPGPPINTSMVGRAEDYVISHYPLELYFVFTTQLCNVTIRARSSGAALARAKLVYVDSEGGEKRELPLHCRDGECEGDIRSGCVLSYDLVAELTYLGLLKLKHEGGKTVLKFADNLWIPAIMAAATMGIILVVYGRGTLAEKRARRTAST